MTDLFGLLVVAPDSDPMFGVIERQREDARGAVASPDWRLVNCPGSSPVSAPEDPAATSAEPGVPLSLEDQAGSACGECSLAWQRLGHTFWGNPAPNLAPVVSRQDLETPIHRVAKGDPTPRVPERQGIEEASGVLVTELEHPIQPTILCLVDPRKWPFADGQSVSCPDVADLEISAIFERYDGAMGDPWAASGE